MTYCRDFDGQGFTYSKTCHSPADFYAGSYYKVRFSSASVGLASHSLVGILGLQYKSVIFGAGQSLGSPKR